MPIIGNKNSIETSSAIFGDLIRENRLLIDKTRFLKDFFNHYDMSEDDNAGSKEGKVFIITRPRRFGKTLLMSTVSNMHTCPV